MMSDTGRLLAKETPLRLVKSVRIHAADVAETGLLSLCVYLKCDTVK